MKFEDTIHSRLSENTKTYNSINTNNALTLTDPITQLCKRIEAFFKADSDVTCRYIVNNSKALGPKIDPDTGEPYTKLIEVDGEQVEAIVENDHFCEFRVFVNDVEKAQCLSNVIRHRHTIQENFLGSDDKIHLRNHYLLVHVCTIDAIDPDGVGGGSDPWTIDDDIDSGVKEVYGLEPIDWSDSVHSGCNERLAPSDESSSDIPKGAPDEYEQRQWEANPDALVWKWQWLKVALRGNKNVLSSKEFLDKFSNTTWRFIECNYIPVSFIEDNLTSIRGYNSVLAADLLPLIFSVFDKIQISTYVRK